jgi:hypothetical protein
MFIKHNNGAQKSTNMEDFSSWGEPFSKRRSEDDNKGKSKDSQSKSKSESESESKDTKRKSESKDIMTIMTDSKTKETKRFQHHVTAKADKVVAIKRNKKRNKDKFRKTAREI